MRRSLWRWRPIVFVMMLALFALAGVAQERQDAAVALQLTDYEKLRIENINLLDELRKARAESDTCRGQLAKPRNDSAQQQVTSAVMKLRADVEAARPGYSWDPVSGQFTKKPDKPEEKPK